MSYTPEQIAAALEGADHFAASPYKNTLGAQKLRVLAEIVREQAAIIRTQDTLLADKREHITALKHNLGISTERARNYEMIAERNRDQVVALEAKADLACASLVSAEKEIERLRTSLTRIGDQAEECGDPANPAFFGLVSLIVDEIDKHKEQP